MLNQTVLIGRITTDPKKGDTSIVLAIPRSYKNENGEYETDMIPVQITGAIAKNTCEYCKKGDLVGIKGRLQYTDKVEIVVEKLTFLSSNHTEEE